MAEFKDIIGYSSIKKELIQVADVLLNKEYYEKLGVKVKIGNLFSSDTFYDDAGSLASWQKMGVLAVEMESAALYMNAARSGKKALCICMISDCPLTGGEECTALEREQTFNKMIEIALEAAE